MSLPRHAHSAKDKPTPSEISQAMRAASLYSWGLTEDRTKRTANARAKFQESFLVEADGDPVRAESLRKAYYAKLALKSAQTRRRNRAARITAEQAGGDAA